MLLHLKNVAIFLSLAVGVVAVVCVSAFYLMFSQITTEREYYGRLAAYRYVLSRSLLLSQEQLSAPIIPSIDARVRDVNLCDSAGIEAAKAAVADTHLVTCAVVEIDTRRGVPGLISCGSPLASYCHHLYFHRDLFENELFKTQILRALSNPCAYLLKPEAVTNMQEPRRGQSTLISFVLSDFTNAWGDLGCDKSRLPSRKMVVHYGPIVETFSF